MWWYGLKGFYWPSHNEAIQIRKLSLCGAVKFVRSKLCFCVLIDPSFRLKIDCCIFIFKPCSDLSQKTGEHCILCPCTLLELLVLSWTPFPHACMWAEYTYRLENRRSRPLERWKERFSLNKEIVLLTHYHNSFRDFFKLKCPPQNHECLSK